MARRITIYYNKPPNESRELLLFRSKDHLVADFEQEVAAGKRIFFTSNSKAKIEQLKAFLDKKYPHVKTKAITADNSNGAEVQDFILNIKERILDHQVVLTSPSLGTGVDITFEEGAVQVDVVYGLFENLVNTHFDIDQQLRRVRHPGDVRVWISPRTFTFETEFEVVRSDIEHEKNGLVAMNWRPELIALAASVRAMERASKNDLKRNFVRYKEAQGFVVKEVVPADALLERGKESLALGKALRDGRRVEQLISALPITQEQYLDIEERRENNEEVSESERLSFARASIEVFYVQAITPEIILRDAGGLRGQVKAYEGLVQGNTKPLWEWLEQPAAVIRPKLQLLPFPTAVPWLLHTLLSHTPLYADHRFKLSVEYCAKDLSAFVEAVEGLAREIENLVDKPIPRDLRTKPTSFLATVLSVAGLGQKRVRKGRTGGLGRTYFYALDPAPIAALDEIVRRRTETKNRWAFVHELHGLDAVLYEKQFRVRANGRGYYELVPVTGGADTSARRRKERRGAAELKIKPQVLQVLKGSSKSTRQKFDKLREKREANAEGERKRRQKDAFKSFS